MRGEIAATKEGKILAIRTHVLADHGAFNGTAAPIKYPAGFFGVFTGSYDLEAAYCSMTAVYTNKAPGGVAYACSFRITEAVYLVERIVDCLAYDLEMDPVELRRKNFIQPDQFPYTTKTGWVYDSGEYERALDLALEMAGYDDLRREQEEKRAKGELMGIGVAFFTEAVGAGPAQGHGHPRAWAWPTAAELRVHPTGKAVVRLSCMSQGQGHETTFAQIVAEEIGIPPADIQVVNGDTDQTPFGLGTYGSRSTPVSGAAAALVARKVRDKAQIIASGMLEVSVADLEWQKGSFHVKGDPGRSVTIQDIAMRAHGAGDLPDGLEGGLEAQICYNPSNLTYPFGAYICVVDIDPGTAEVKVRRFVAVDDCGTRINPMIIEGQVHGGLTDGVGMALMEMISFDEDGNCLAGSLMDYLIPTALEVPHWETGHTVTPSPHHPIGAKGVGESATVGSPPAVVNAVIDALKPYGIRHADMPLTPSRVWDAMQGRPDPADLSGRAGRRDHDDRGAGRRAQPLRGAVRPGDGRARPGAELGAPRRPGDHPRRRVDRGLRRRPLRRRLGAHRRARRARDRARACCCGCCPTATTRSPSRPVRASWSTRACPEEPWRSTSSRCCRRPPCTSSAPRRPPRRSPTLAPALGFVVDRSGASGRAGRARPRWSCPPTAATSRARSGPRSTPGSASSGWSAAAPAAQALLDELDLPDGGGRAGARARRARHRRADGSRGGAVDPGRGGARDPRRRAGAPPARAGAPAAPGGRPGLRDDRDDRPRHRRTPSSTVSTTGSACPAAATASWRTTRRDRTAAARRRRRPGAGRRGLPPARAAQAAARLPRRHPARRHADHRPRGRLRARWWSPWAAPPTRSGRGSTSTASTWW